MSNANSLIYILAMFPGCWAALLCLSLSHTSSLVALPHNPFVWCPCSQFMHLPPPRSTVAAIGIRSCPPPPTACDGRCWQPICAPIEWLSSNIVVALAMVIRNFFLYISLQKVLDSLGSRIARNLSHSPGLVLCTLVKFAQPHPQGFNDWFFSE